MKTLTFALAFVAMVCAYDITDIPPHMIDRLDHYLALKREWFAKWTSMTEQEQKNYEQILISRLEHLPETQHQLILERIQAMPEDHRLKLRDYLVARFQSENTHRQQFPNEVHQIDAIIMSLPEAIREKVNGAIKVLFQDATAYGIDDELDFPDVPELVDVPDAVAFSMQLDDNLRIRLDEFLLKREDWKRKWEQLSEEKRVVFEQYINERLVS